jgi:solute carrier family 35 protein F5
MLLMWPFLFLWSVIGWENLSFPTGNVLGFLTLNGLAGTVLSDYLWLFSILLLSPVISTVGLSLSIPVAMIADMLIKGATFPPLYILGSVLVAIGFVIVNSAGYIKDKCSKYKCIK